MRRDITGQKFNRLTAIKYVSMDKIGAACWLFKCDCGKEKNIRSSLVTGGYTKSCSCSCFKKEKARIDMTGRKFGRLIAIKPAGKNKWGQYLWLFKCDCGKERIIVRTPVRHGRTKSCGCLAREKVIERNKKGMARTHHMSNTQIYRVWNGMKQRCSNQNIPSYSFYGSRGIKVCDRWQKFEGFRDDMYTSFLDHVEKYGQKSTWIERIDNDGNYCPENCRWATPKEQANNRRNI